MGRGQKPQGPEYDLRQCMVSLMLINVARPARAVGVSGAIAFIRALDSLSSPANPW